MVFEAVVNLWKWLFLLLLMVGLAWAAPDVAPVDREQALRQRVQERWAALIKKDWAVAYSFEAPVFRAAYPLEQYQAKFGKDIIWEAVTINHVLFEGDEVATVYVNVQYQPVRLIAGEAHRFDSQVTEKWIRSADQWWHASPTMGSKL
jgi:hypothetical protein